MIKEMKTIKRYYKEKSITSNMNSDDQLQFPMWSVMGQDITDYLTLPTVLHAIQTWRDDNFMYRLYRVNAWLLMM
jgi:hypothetical protein